jgi:hypothetical protein
MSEHLPGWDDRSIRITMAGDGNPYYYLTPLRKQLIWALYHQIQLRTARAQLCSVARAYARGTYPFN